MVPVNNIPMAAVGRDLDSPLSQSTTYIPHYHEGLFINSSTENPGGAQDRSSLYIFPILKGLGREIEFKFLDKND